MSFEHTLLFDRLLSRRLKLSDPLNPARVLPVTAYPDENRADIAKILLGTRMLLEERLLKGHPGFLKFLLRSGYKILAAPDQNGVTRLQRGAGSSSRIQLYRNIVTVLTPANPLLHLSGPVCNRGFDPQAFQGILDGLKIQFEGLKDRPMAGPRPAYERFIKFTSQRIHEQQARYPITTKQPLVLLEDFEMLNPALEEDEWQAMLELSLNRRLENLVVCPKSTVAPSGGSDLADDLRLGPDLTYPYSCGDEPRCRDITDPSQWAGPQGADRDLEKMDEEDIDHFWFVSPESTRRKASPEQTTATEAIVTEVIVPMAPVAQAGTTSGIVAEKTGSEPNGPDKVRENDCPLLSEEVPLAESHVKEKLAAEESPAPTPTRSVHATSIELAQIPSETPNSIAAGNSAVAKAEPAQVAPMGTEKVSAIEKDVSFSKMAPPPTKSATADPASGAKHTKEPLATHASSLSGGEQKPPPAKKPRYPGLEAWLRKKAAKGPQSKQKPWSPSDSKRNQFKSGALSREASRAPGGTTTRIAAPRPLADETLKLRDASQPACWWISGAGPRPLQLHDRVTALPWFCLSNNSGRVAGVNQRPEFYENRQLPECGKQQQGHQHESRRGFSEVLLKRPRGPKPTCDVASVMPRTDTQLSSPRLPSSSSLGQNVVTPAPLTRGFVAA